jgi:hypothetical protein
MFMAANRKKKVMTHREREKEEEKKLNDFGETFYARSLAGSEWQRQAQLIDLNVIKRTLSCQNLFNKAELA